MDSFVVPQNFIDDSNITNSCSICIQISLKFLYVVIFGWNRVFTKNQEKIYNSSFVMFGEFFDGFSGFLGKNNLKQCCVQPSSLMRSSRFMPKPFVISLRACSSFVASSALSSSWGRSVALSLKSSSLIESNLSSTCFNWVLLTTTLT